jgi:hypothetical protein
MYVTQNLSIAFPIFSSLVERVSHAWQRIAKRVKENRDAARQREAVARLSHHLSYDAGYSEYRLPPTGPAHERDPHQTLETMWLSYGARNWMERR